MVGCLPIITFPVSPMACCPRSPLPPCIYSWARASIALDLQPDIHLPSRRRDDSDIATHPRWPGYPRDCLLLMRL